MPRASFVSVAFPLALALLLGATAAAAQSAPLDLRNFQPPAAPYAGLYTEATQVPNAGEWNASWWASYAHELLVVQDEGGASIGEPLDHQWSFDLQAALGVTGRLQLGLTLPLVVAQSGSGEALLGGEGVPGAALGDPTLDLKANWLRPRGLGGFGFSTIGRFTVPVGNDQSYVGHHTLGAEYRALADLSLLALHVRATAGVRLRGERALFDERLGSDLPWGFGVVLRPQVFGIDREGHWLWQVEVRGNLALSERFAKADTSPVLAGVSARYSAGPWSLLGGVELPAHSALGAPGVRAVVGLGFVPRVADADSDGIADQEDGCPELAEDRDGFEDSDGCPDFDNDGDGVPDDLDRCPQALEDEDGFLDEDGCPDPDNDGDGVADDLDSCPLETARPEDNPDSPGCPPPDRDGDTYDNRDDRCPGEAEVFNGFKDGDGCPDRMPAGRPEKLLVRRVETANGTVLRIEGRVRLTQRRGSVELGRRSVLLARAIAQLLNRDPDAVLLVGVRPREASAEAEQTALNQAFSLVHALRGFTRRDTAAEVVGWNAVREEPGAERAGVGFVLLTPQHEARP
jgi:hypothetical protein